MTGPAAGTAAGVVNDGSCPRRPRVRAKPRFACTVRFQVFQVARLHALMMMRLVHKVTRLHQLHILLHHLRHESLEGDLRLPPEQLLGLRRIANEQVDLSGSKVLRVNLDQLAGLIARINADFVNSALLARPLNLHIDGIERLLHELAHRVALVGGEDEVLRLVALHHQPHSLHVVAGMAPVTLRVDVSQEENVLKPLGDAADRAGDLARDEGRATARALMVEEDTVRKVHAVGLTVVHDHPVGVLLSNTVGRARVERSGLGLRNLLDLAV
mmetsp:Transcript_44843/g.122660  ORF Transcript_44843/g.122660 Transcript_44843/m.122660 type:complete len:271 (+) Transcript_44843:172-984(+)